MIRVIIKTLRLKNVLLVQRTVINVNLKKNVKYVRFLIFCRTKLVLRSVLMVINSMLKEISNFAKRVEQKTVLTVKKIEKNVYLVNKAIFYIKNIASNLVKKISSDKSSFKNINVRIVK